MSDITVTPTSPPAITVTSQADGPILVTVPSAPVNVTVAQGVALNTLRYILSDTPPENPYVGLVHIPAP